MAGERWIFTKEQIANTPSVKSGYTESKELQYRQLAANIIQNMGQRLQLSQLCINTAVVYMHRFYMFHSFQRFNWRKIAAACLFLAAKVEEQPRKLELVIKAAHHFGPREEGGAPPPSLDTKSQDYLERVQELVINENILLQALGFNVTIDHSNTHVVKLCQQVKAPKDLSQTSYFLSTNSLLLTNMCLQYSSRVIAAVCIHLACKWSDWELQPSKEGKFWWQYLDQNLALEKLEEITKEFLSLMEKADPALKKQLMARLKLPCESSPNSGANSPAPVPSNATSSAPLPAELLSRVSGSAQEKSSASTSKPAAPTNEVPVAKTYAEHREHRERSQKEHRTASEVHSKNKSSHIESQLAKGDLKRPHPKDSHSHSSSAKQNSLSASPNHPNSSHNPYNQQPRNNENRQHYKHNLGPSLESSPIKKARYGENGNGESKPPLPPGPPMPKPPLPP